MNVWRDSVSVTILYLDPERPDEAGMTMITGQVQLKATIERLERQGFSIEKITVAQSTSTRAAAEAGLDWPLSKPD
jgi:hypothetical protein